MVNRVGDVSLILAMGLIFTNSGSLNFSAFLGQSVYVQNLSVFITLSGLFLLLAAVGKSAQIGLHT